jgi:serine/threonine protein kinase
MPILTSSERIGTRVADKYELLSVLGKGGMGVVYQAVHRWTGRRVAVKLIDPALADDPEVGARFLNEARAAAAIAHPNVVDVLDMGRDEDGTVYQALELLEGETLSEFLRAHGTVSVENTQSLMRPVMDALEHAHQAGIVHRDVKPGNIFLRRRESGEREAVLLDFGMAKLLDGQPVTTRSSVVLGTPHYMAPEQALASSDVGPAADIWAMGAILFECLSGTLPFGSLPPAAYLARAVYERAQPLAEAAPHLPLRVCAVVDRALSREPEARQRSMAELMRALDGVEESASSSSTRTLERKLSSSPVRHSGRAIALMCVLSLLAVASWWLARERAHSSAEAPRQALPGALVRPGPAADLTVIPPSKVVAPATAPAPSPPTAQQPPPRVRAEIRPRDPAVPGLPRGMTEEW